jgi:ABC-type transport system involved in multi-copper enzyme maturation permease subunit
MTRLVRIEILKLRTTPALYVASLITLVLAVAGVTTTILLAGQGGTPAVGTVANVSKALQVSALTSMVMLVLGILSVAGEYRNRTIMSTFLAETRRGKVIVAKLLTTGALGAVLGGVTFGLALAVALPVYAAKGVHSLPVDLRQMWIGCVLASMCFGLLGVALGALTRNTVGAIIGGLVWVQIVEVGILQSAVPSIAKWLPTGAGVAVTAGPDATTLLAPGVAAVVLVAWAAVLAVVATSVISRSELR